VRAMVYLGANACIVGRNHEKTKTVAADIETVRNGARVLGYGGVDVRNFNDLKTAVDNCAKELGSIDFVMLVPKYCTGSCLN
jgi:2,4-dienoyl-CoA reductase [(3E)-enoyl-CoA-producing], peroxisomal